MSNVARVADVKGVTRALSLLNSTAGKLVDPRIDTLVVFSETQQGHFTLHLTAFQSWGPGSRFDGNIDEVQSFVFLTPPTVKKGAGGGKGTAYPFPNGNNHIRDDDEAGTGRPLSAAEALKAYKINFPKAKGMADRAILDYIEAIQCIYNAKKSSGDLRIDKIATILQACTQAKLMGPNKQGQPAPFYQRGGRKNFRSKALEAIFHWVTGFSPKKKHGAGGGGDGDDDGNDVRAPSSAAAAVGAAGASGAGGGGDGGGGGGSGDAGAGVGSGGLAVAPGVAAVIAVSGGGIPVAVHGGVGVAGRGGGPLGASGGGATEVVGNKAVVGGGGGAVVAGGASPAASLHGGANAAVGTAGNNTGVAGAVHQPRLPMSDRTAEQASLVRGSARE
jgi:hypothetical protein